MAEALLPIGTVEGTIDSRLAPPNLVEGTYDDKTKKCTGAKLVGPWTEKTDEGVGAVVSVYSELATESGTQVNGQKKSRVWRVKGASVQTVRESVRRSHAQIHQTSAQIEQTIKMDLGLLGIWDEPDSSNYENRYNQLGRGGWGSELSQATMACSFKNRLLALKEEKEAKELEELEKKMRTLEKKIKKKQKSQA
jgi:hypothetical protein